MRIPMMDVRFGTFFFLCSFVLASLAVPRRESEWFGEDGLMLRLTGGKTVDEGVVEVFYNDTWGSICDDLVTKATADIICRMLDYPRAKECHCCGRLGRLPAETPIWVDQLDCMGPENSIFACNRSEFGEHDCKHYEDVGVVCERPRPLKREVQIRLYCPEDATGTCNSCPAQRQPRVSTNGTDCTDVIAVQGFIQVFLPEVDNWVFVSAEGWDDPDVTVACGQLGYPGEFGYPLGSDFLGCDPVDPSCGGADFQSNITMVTMRNIDCSGLEHNLGQCLHFGWGVSANPGKEAATVACGYRERHNGCSDEAQTRIRLRGGPVPSEGRVEAFRDGQWGSVRDDTFFFPEGNVVCRSLGYGTVRQYHHNSYFGIGIGPVAIPWIRCRGNETSHENCQLSRSVHQDQHMDDVGVECNRPMERCQEIARYHREGQDNFLEVQVRGVWGLACNEMLNQTDLTVICKDLSSKFSEGVRRGSTTYNNGTRFTGRFDCTGDELFLEDCNMMFLPVEVCPGGEAIIDCGRALPDLVPRQNLLENSFVAVPFLTVKRLDQLTCELEENCLASDAQVLANESKLNSRRKLLTFNVLADNRGMIDFRPFALSSEWEYHDCHKHYHAFDEFAVYDLRHPDGRLAAEGLKASFCLADSGCFAPNARPRYRCRDLSDQGISVGCGDLYSSRTPCQWIDVTNVPPGNYQLEVTLNPKRQVPELDFANNQIVCNITLFGEVRLTGHGCIIRGYC